MGILWTALSRKTLVPTRDVFVPFSLSTAINKGLDIFFRSDKMQLSGPVALAEVGKIDSKENCLWLAHEGSSAHSLAESPSMAHILPGGDKGTVVGLALKPMPEVTIGSLSGRNDTYRMLVAQGGTKPITEKEWVDGGKKLLVKLSLNCNVKEAFDKMLSEGIDHHLLLKKGNVTSYLTDLCDLLGIKKVCL